MARVNVEKSTRQGPMLLQIAKLLPYFATLQQFDEFVKHESSCGENVVPAWHFMAAKFEPAVVPPFSAANRDSPKRPKYLRWNNFGRSGIVKIHHVANKPKLTPEPARMV